MPGTPVSIGPFFGGMNDTNDPSTIEDEQCAMLFNFDIDTDGSIITRPSFRATYQGGAGVNGLAGFTPITTYTYFSQRFVIGVGKNSVNNYYETLVAIDYDTGIRSVAISTPSAKYVDAVQYDDKLWVLSEANPTNGGWWTPTDGWSSVADMPKGIAMLVYKERLFIINEKGRLYFSDLADFTKWNASSFFDVNPGDGQKVRGMLYHMGQIIIFKEHSTYVFAYDSAPENASIQQVSATIGTESIKSFVAHENIIYTFHNNKLYAINNWRWQDVSYKVHIADPPNLLTAPQEYRTGTAMVASVGRRVIVRYRTKFWVYYPDLESWAKWGNYYDPTADDPAQNNWDVFLRIPWVRSDGYIEYWVGNYINRSSSGSIGVGTRTYAFVDGYTDYSESYAIDSFQALVRSKMYDYQLPYNFKRLHWWGVDLESKKSINARVLPVNYNKKMTWDELKALGLTWNAAKALGKTWDRPSDIAIDVSDSYEIDYVSNIRAFIKYIKSMRFRKITFEISTMNSGTLKDGPLQIFSAVAVISNKQLGPRKAN